MNLYLYPDIWELIGLYLSSDDLYSFSLVSKNSQKACRRFSLKRKISYPMICPWRLTYEQRNVIKEMEKGYNRFKLIHGEVGSGKTIVSTSYALRNYSSPESKIVMCGPPSLVQMWWSTLRNYFGVEPAVYHQTNAKYQASMDWSEVPTEKVLIFSYKVFNKHNPQWFRSNRDLLIIDEAHHRSSLPYESFKEVVGLSATTSKKTKIARGIKCILDRFGLELETCTYKLGNNIIAKKLPPVKYHSYIANVSKEVIRKCNYKIVRNRDGSYDNTVVSDICKLLTHPQKIDLDDTFTAGFIMINRKRFVVDRGDSSLYSNALLRLRYKFPNLSPKERKNKMAEVATYDIMKFGNGYNKYVQAYHIVKKANDLGEKVIIFDQSVGNLPFLMKYLTDNGLNTYIFSTHYDVSGRQRQLFKFKKDKLPGVLLSSINMLGEGQNVTEANHLIFLTHCMDPTKYHQAIGRCWRYPQSKTVNIHLLFGTMFDRKVYDHACGVSNINHFDWEKLLV